MPECYGECAVAMPRDKGVGDGLGPTARYCAGDVAGAPPWPTFPSPPNTPGATVWPVTDPPEPLFGSREKRVVYNEDWCRDLNERKAKAKWIESGNPVAGFRCECWQLDCAERIPLSGGEWEEARSKPNRFA